jgi:hypothetical protein
MPRRILSAFVVLFLLIPIATISPALPSAPSRAAQDATPQICLPPVGYDEAGVNVTLESTFAPRDVVSFGLPVPAGTLQDAETLGVSLNGAPVEATARVLLTDAGANGAPSGIRSVLIQFPSAALSGGCDEVRVSWQGGGVTVSETSVPFSETSAASNETIDQAAYGLEEQNGQATLTISEPEERVLFESREPAVTAVFPPGYLAATGLFGDLVTADQAGPDYAGLQFILDSVQPFGLSAMYEETYPINERFVVDPLDPELSEGWLYDRCTTFLSFYAVTGDTRFLREAYRICAFYAASIRLEGEWRGTFTGTTEPDDKYSHGRGLYGYYALTGDETAFEAGVAIADYFLTDQFVSAPYQQGVTRGYDKLWTERQLGAALEAEIYGWRISGDREYLDAATRLVATTHRHITGDPATLAQILPDAVVQFPPQNCLVHNALQASEGNEDWPWCSGWMPVLMVDALLVYQQETNDPRVDEIFVRLTRFFRDTGSAYWSNDFGNSDDSFLFPSREWNPDDQENPRVLLPLYGSGIDVDGTRRNFGDYDDIQHCLDVTAITAAGIRALTRMGTFDVNPVGPFASEGESFVALHQEFAWCARWTLEGQTRPFHDPAWWTPEYLEQGLADPDTFIYDDYGIGDVLHNIWPKRKIGWWFNAALEQFALLRDAGVTMPELTAGSIAPGDVAADASPTFSPAVVPTEPAPPTPTPNPDGSTGGSSEAPPPAAEEGGAAATGDGSIVYTLTDGTIWRIAAEADAEPEKLADAFDTESTAPDYWIDVSNDGEWLLLQTERFFPDCAGWPCLVLASSDLSSRELVAIDGQPVRPGTGLAAVANGGNLIVYSLDGGPHGFDLWAITREDDGWSAPVLLTGEADAQYHQEPSISDDGTTVLFACGEDVYTTVDTGICEVGTDGSGLRVVIGPDGGPDGAPENASLRHPDYGPDGEIIFTADWNGAFVWRLGADAAEPEIVGPAFGGEYLACSLPDGRIASLWPGRSSVGNNELKVMSADGSSYVMLVTDTAIADLGCSA